MNTPDISIDFKVGDLLDAMESNESIDDLITYTPSANSGITVVTTTTPQQIKIPESLEFTFTMNSRTNWKLAMSTLINCSTVFKSVAQVPDNKLQFKVTTNPIPTGGNNLQEDINLGFIANPVNHTSESVTVSWDPRIIVGTGK